MQFSVFPHMPRVRNLRLFKHLCIYLFFSSYPRLLLYYLLGWVSFLFYFLLFYSVCTSWFLTKSTDTWILVLPCFQTKEFRSFMQFNICNDVYEFINKTYAHSHMYVCEINYIYFFTKYHLDILTTSIWRCLPLYSIIYIHIYT